MLSSSEVLAAILEKPTDLAHVRAGHGRRDLCFAELRQPRSAQYHALARHARSAGPESIVQTFVDDGRSGRRCPSRWRLYSAQASTLPCSGASATNRR